ncbi:hypothetical protein [Mycetocola sp. JXN-3]|uniref:hypothetical protein n=1 Tax=Mycetocola sp. JXN-3 TaxID=2116510 RepID=UPI00165D2A0D|nr:hypothetical protein [Mycetocola sp. JXN-3]
MSADETIVRWSALSIILADDSLWVTSMCCVSVSGLTFLFEEVFRETARGPVFFGLSSPGIECPRGPYPWDPEDVVKSYSLREIPASLPAPIWPNGVAEQLRRSGRTFLASAGTWTGWWGMLAHRKRPKREHL